MVVVAGLLFSIRFNNSGLLRPRQTRLGQRHVDVCDLKPDIDGPRTIGLASGEVLELLNGLFKQG